MSKRNCHPPHHESPHEQRLREIVDSLVTDISEKEAYVAFAHELAISVRREPVVFVIPRERSDSRNLAARETGRDPSIGVGVTRGREPSQRTKRVVQKYFERGLHGHLLWLVGQAVTQEQLW